MPGAGFQRHASKFASIIENELVKKPYEIARQNLVSHVLSSMSYMPFAHEELFS
jgi:hypothetical protein